jgi:glucosylceramidase
MPAPKLGFCGCLSTVGCAAAAACAVLATASADAAQTRSSEPPPVHVWLTTPDGQSKLQDAGTVSFSTTPPTALTITIDPLQRYQPVDGVGASITDSSAEVMYRLSPSNRDAAMASLFDPVSGAGLGVLRQPIGGSDFVAEAAYTYNDLPAGETDHAMQRFSIAHDEQKILPLLRQALALNPQIRIVATPWSPPAWMKTNGSLVGGELIDTPEIYSAYALYFVKFVQAYQAAGVPVHAITVQNEPQNRTPDGYPGMGMSATQQAKFIAVLGPALQAAGLRTRIFAYDHNWSMHPDDIADVPPGQPVETEYPSLVAADPQASPWVRGVAYHCYYGEPARQTQFRDDHLRLPVYFTECSGSKNLTDPPEKTFSETLRWHSRNLAVGVMRNWGRTVVNWNLALDPAGGPHVGGCATCTGVITVGPDQAVTRNAEYHVLGHIGKFVRAGATRIGSTSFGSTAWNGQIMSVAFRNTDGSTVLVVHNQNDAPGSFSAAVGNQQFGYTLPGGALATFTWPASAVLDDGLPRLSPTPMAASALPAGPTDLCCVNDVAANLVDDEASTRWASGTAQAPGQFVQVDLGAHKAMSRVVLDAGTSSGDYPRGYALHLSDDGVNWGDPVVSGSGSGQLTVIDLPQQRRARYLRVVSTASAPNWWSVADLRVYR